VVTVISRKAASMPHTAGSIVFARLHQCASHLVHCNRHPHRTGYAPCRVAFSISTAGMSGHVLGVCFSP